MDRAVQMERSPSPRGRAARPGLWAIVLVVCCLPVWLLAGTQGAYASTVYAVAASGAPDSVVEVPILFDLLGTETGINKIQVLADVTADAGAVALTTNLGVNGVYATGWGSLQPQPPPNNTPPTLAPSTTTFDWNCAGSTSRFVAVNGPQTGYEACRMLVTLPAIAVGGTTYNVHLVAYDTVAKTGTTVKAATGGPIPPSGSSLGPDVKITVSPPHTFSVAASATPDTVASGKSTDLSATPDDSLGHGVATWAWSDDGAGGSFSPSTAVQDPTYTAPANTGDSDVTVTLTVTATCDGPSPLSDSDSTILTVHPLGVCTVGLYAPEGGVYFLRNSNSAGVADLTFHYGPTPSTWKPLAGDWDGDGTTSVGSYDPASGTFFLRNSNSPGAADLTVRYGPTSSTWLPIAGDWDGDGVVTIGLYDPATGRFLLRNSNTPGIADLTFRFGPTGGTWLPIVGDWDGNGTDTVGLYNPASGTCYLRNSNSGGVADLTFRFGPTASTWKPIAGDWDQDGVDTVGLYNPTTGTFYLRNSNNAGPADVTFRYGPAPSTWLPIAGDWDGL